MSDEKIIDSKYYDNVTDKITTKDFEPVERLLFKKQYAQYTHIYDSYNRWIDKSIPEYLTKARHIIYEERNENSVVRHLFRFSNIEFHLPRDETPNEKIITPTIAKIRNLTYSSKLMAKVEQIMEIQDIRTKQITTNVLYTDTIPIAKIPIMIRSAFCVTNTNIAPNVKNMECPYDPGCGFIVKGSEKFITSLEQIADNRIYVFTRKGTDDDLIYFAKITSRARSVYGNAHMCEMSIDKNMGIRVNIGKNIDINVFILMRALGIETDKDIYEHIVYDLSDSEMVNVVKQSLFSNNSEMVVFPDGKTDIIIKQTQALEYLKTKMFSRRFSDTNQQDKLDQQYYAIVEYLKNDFLPHLGNTEEQLLIKGKFLGYMSHSLLLCYLGRSEPDNRDSYVNKRVELPGELLNQLFKPAVKKMINETSKKFRKKIRGMQGANYPNVISVILQSNTIEITIIQSLATGAWGGIGSKRKGVAQMLQRFTFLQSISYLRRVMSSSSDKTNKNINMRYVDQHCYGYIDSIETPEGENIGLVKNLALSSHVTLSMPEQIPIIKNILEGVDYIYGFDIPLIQYKRMAKIFINGEWIGFTDRAFKLINFLKDKRFNGEINRNVSFTYKESTNKDTREVRINTDGGRLIRPLLKVSNNELVITKEILAKINNNYYDIPDAINSLNQLLTEYPGIIEYVDVEESTNACIAMYARDVTENYDAANEALDNPNERGDLVNRYNKLYKRYTHCEIHPMLMLGFVSSNIVLMEHNQSPRNYYYFSQARQAMGIPTSNYKKTAALSYLLYNTSKPLVVSRASEYTNTDKLPAGENVVVAIASYGGYNQEDSIVMNMSAIDRGLFRATVYKKYEDVIKKNSSGYEDEFGIKDKALVKGINEKEKNYNKVNEKGFAPEETKIVNGDILIAKVAQFTDKNDSRKYKDESQPYKSNVGGYVDRVWHNKLTNAENYPMIKMRIRSERVPIVGDKFCMTGDHYVMTNHGWIRFDELYENRETLDVRVAQLNEGRIEYVKPIGIYEFDYEGQMYKLDSRLVEFQVTMDHKLYVKRDEEFELIDAKDVIGKKVDYKKNGVPISGDAMDELLEITKGNDVVYATSKKMAEDIQIMAIHAGISATIEELTIKLHYEEMTNDNYDENIIDYEGKVYCLEVPSGVFMVGYNGKNHWTGNCSRHGKIFA